MTDWQEQLQFAVYATDRVGATNLAQKQAAAVWSTYASTSFSNCNGLLPGLP